MDVLIYLLLFLVIAAAALGPPVFLVALVRTQIYGQLDTRGKRDFRIGVCGAIFVNALVIGIFYLIATWFETARTPLPRQVRNLEALTPWLVNGGMIGITLWARPKIATGILSLIGSLIAWAVLSFSILVVGCVAVLTLAGLASGFGS